MIKKYNFIVINFFRVTDPYSGASEVSFNFFKNIPSEQKNLFQFSDNSKKYKKVHSIQIKNTRWQKILNLKKISDSVIKFATNKKNLIIIIEGASWVGYAFFVYKLLKRKLKNSKFIYHSHNIEYLLRKEKESYAIVALTKFFENYIAKKFNIFTCVSKIDKKKIKKIYNINATILSNGVEVSEDINKIKIKNFNFNYVFFCGSIKYFPNFDALKILVEKIMPLVISKDPAIKLVVSGNEDLPFKKNFLVNAGFLSKKNFYEHLRGASLFVNPMKIGFGSQLKTINALVFGKTVIASELAVGGININPNFKNLFITDDNKKIADLILKHINSRKINKLSSNYYLKKYSMKNITKSFFSDQGLST